MTSTTRMHALARALSEIGGDLAVARGRWRRAHQTMSNFERHAFDVVEHAIIDMIIHIHSEIDDLELADGAARNES